LSKGAGRRRTAPLFSVPTKYQCCCSAANKLKDEGNKLFSSNDFKGAVAKFTAAIELDATNEGLRAHRDRAAY
jgi:hypothetical protein